MQGRAPRWEDRQLWCGEVLEVPTGLRSLLGQDAAGTGAWTMQELWPGLEGRGTGQVQPVTCQASGKTGICNGG